MKPQGLAKQEVDLFDEETSEKAKELAQAYRESKSISSTEALIVRSALNKQLYDVFLVDHKDLHNTIQVLENVEFDAASRYVDMYNAELGGTEVEQESSSL